LVEGNQLVDSFAGAVVVPGKFEQARRSHDFYHQNAKALARMFHLPLMQACQIVTACPECQCAGPPQPGGVNPHGLQVLELWQTDITHLPDFGRLKYVHVSVDTFLGAIAATAH
ncbi:POK7 protein, partial [Oceanites oceanicus]|nr:POK7 protein [Oceanites oceanicus]